MLKRSRCWYWVVGVIFSGICLPSWAGFSLLPTIGDVNRSRAGGSAAAEDAITAYSNPAGMIRLEGSQIAAVAEVYFSSATFTNDNSTDALGNPLSGGNGGDGGSTTLVPSFYFTHAMNNNWAFGLSINSPFGLSTEYDPDTWTEKTEIPEPGRVSHASFKIIDKGYICGGCEEPLAGPLQDCDEYYPDTWTSKSDMPPPIRFRFAATTI